MTIQIRKNTILAALIPSVILGILVGSMLFSDDANAQQNLVPTWIKNVAQFWSNDDIADQEFVNAMEYLVGEGVMEIPNYVSVAEAQEMASNLEEQGIIVIGGITGLEEQGIIVIGGITGLEEQGIIVIGGITGLEEQGIIVIGGITGLEEKGIILIGGQKALTADIRNLQADVTEIKNILRR